MDGIKYDVPKSIRQSIERTVDLLVENHEAFQMDPFLISVDNIVENILKSEEIQSLIVNLQQEISNVTVDDVIAFDSENDIGNRNENVYQIQDLELLGRNRILVFDQKTWVQEAKVLREQLLSKNNDTFTSSFKKHILLITNPQTLNEGALNIIHTLKLHFSRTFKQNVSNNFRISLRIGTQRNILKLIRLLLQSFKFIFRNHKQSVIEMLILQLLELVNFGCNKKKIEQVNILNYFSLLDPTAEWFADLSFNSFNRNIILNYFLKNYSLVEYLLEDLILNKNIVKNFEVDQNLRNFVLHDKSEILNVILRTATFSHSLYIIGHLLCYDHIHKLPFFKVKLYEAFLCEYSLINIFMEITMSFLQHQKLKTVLVINIMKTVLIKHSYLFNLPETNVYKLLEPLYVEKSKHNIGEIAKTTFYIYEICNEISKHENGFCILFNIGINFAEKSKYKLKRYDVLDKVNNTPISISKIIKQHLMRENDNLCIVDILCNFEAALLRFFLNNNKKYDSDFTLPFDILNYLNNILTCENHILTWYKCQKLQMSIKDIYKFLLDQKDYALLLYNLEYFLFGYCTTLSNMKNFEDDQDIFYLFSLNYLNSEKCKFWDSPYFYDFVLNMIDNVYGCEAILNKITLIVNPKLLNIINLNSNQKIFLSGSDRLIEEAIFDFLQIMFTFTYSLKAIQIVLKGSFEKMPQSSITSEVTNVYELIENCLNRNGPGNYISYTGLLLIRMLSYNLDIFLYLENKFKIQEKLIKLQNQILAHKIERSSPCKDYLKVQLYILDETSQLRQEIIECLHHLSSFSVKITPVPVKKNISGTSIRKQINELQRFLKETKNNLHDNSWLIQCRRAHKMCLHESIKEFVVIELIKQVKMFYPNTKNDFSWPTSDVELKDLHQEEKIGVTTIVRFGMQNRLIQNGTQNEESLTLLIKQTKLFLKQPKEQYNGFDWFVGVMFLICGGNFEKTKNVLSIITKLPCGRFVWPGISVHENSSFYSTFESQIKIILREVDHLDNVLESAQISVNGLIKYMLNQCFFNILQWNEICHFLAIVILFSAEYLVYYFISIFKYLKKPIMEALISKDLNMYKKILCLEEFKIKDAFPIMESMAKHYKSFFTN